VPFPDSSGLAILKCLISGDGRDADGLQISKGISIQYLGSPRLFLFAALSILSGSSTSSTEVLQKKRVGSECDNLTYRATPSR